MTKAVLSRTTVAEFVAAVENESRPSVPPVTSR
jgi:hypothetical protein